MYNPFTIDDNHDIMTLSQALRAVDGEMNRYNHEPEDDMDEPKKMTKKVVPAKSVAPAAKVTKAVKPVEKKEAAPKVPAVKKAPTHNLKPRTIPEGHIGVADLAKELGVEPKAVRIKLRTIEGLTKPDSGLWSWKENSRELASIRKAFAKTSETKPAPKVKATPAK